MGNLTHFYEPLSEQCFLITFAHHQMLLPRSPEGLPTSGDSDLCSLQGSPHFFLHLIPLKSAEKPLVVLRDSKWNMNQQCEPVAKKTALEG